MAEEKDVKPQTGEDSPAEEKKKKPGKKDSQIEKLNKELADKTDLLARTAAEFDNYKKRTEREKASIAEYAKSSVIKTLLPILDNIDRASAADKESPEYIKGIELIVKQFGELAENLGVTEIGSIGEKFDPNFHDAVMHIEDENFGDNEIADILQKGYKLGDTVIRPAMVKVAN